MKLCFENKHLHSTRKPGAPCGARWWLPVKKSLLVWAALHCPVALAGEEAFQIDRIGAGEGCRIVAVNKSAAPVTVVARLAGRAYRSNRKWPLKAVVAPHSSMEMARVFAKDGGDPCRVDMRHSDGVGDAFAVPDRNHRYPLPFGKGVYLRVVQAPGGVLTTHKDALNRHAVDFGIPVGTPVLAVRAGTVIEVRDGFGAGRADPALAEKTNLVSIVHADGTFALYAHLAPNRISVRPGEKVEAGQVIAHSGKSGFAAGPHLHFDLRRAVIGPDGVVTQESLPFAFYRKKSGEKIALRHKRRIMAD